MVTNPRIKFAVISHVTFIDKAVAAKIIHTIDNKLRINFLRSKMSPNGTNRRFPNAYPT